MIIRVVHRVPVVIMVLHPLLPAIQGRVIVAAQISAVAAVIQVGEYICEHCQSVFDKLPTATIRRITANLLLRIK